MKKIIKSLIPPILLDTYKKTKDANYGWHGDYKSWEEVKKDSTGYDSNEILQKVRSSLLKVKNGEAVYERDSVLFDETHYSWPLLTGLMYAAALSGGRLHVVDFGGSLGSTYFQNKKFLNGLKDVSWNVIEQKHFVNIGKEDFEDNRLKFFYDIEKCMETEKPNVLILSSVLQYIEKPYELLNELLKYSFDFVLMDLTPVSTGNERLTIQKVHPSIYNAAYPCWMLDKKKIDDLFNQNSFILVEEFEALNGYEVISRGKKIGKYIGEIRRKV